MRRPSISVRSEQIKFALTHLQLLQSSLGQAFDSGIVIQTGIHNLAASFLVQANASCPYSRLDD